MSKHIRNFFLYRSTIGRQNYNFFEGMFLIAGFTLGSQRKWRAVARRKWHAVARLKSSYQRTRIDWQQSRVATQLRLPKSWQHLDKTRQIEFIRGYARFTLEHFPLCQRMTLTTKMYYPRLYIYTEKRKSFASVVRPVTDTHPLFLFYEYLRHDKVRATEMVVTDLNSETIAHYKFDTRKVHIMSDIFFNGLVAELIYFN
jgi:hypothetical protein